MRSTLALNDTPTLSVTGLTVSFATRAGRLTALDDVTFDIGRGEVLGIVGESGAGKSLTGLAVARLIDPPGTIDKGSIALDGERIETLSERAMRHVRGRRIAMIFQDPSTSLDPLERIGAQLIETIRTHLPLSARAARERALALLADVDIPDPERRIDAYPHEFSGGQRQRVVIALALCADPALVIADEPTTALDVTVQAQIVALLKRLAAQRGMALMLITHDMGVIADLADRVCVMYAGRIIEMGAVGDVTREPLHPYTRGLMGAIPSLAAGAPRLVQIPGAMPRLSAIPPGCAFHPRCDQAFARCRIERPALIPRGRRKVACHLYDETSA